jgi:protein-L-isoaspartate(D-aspartate) O-methyltransferase
MALWLLAACSQKSVPAEAGPSEADARDEERLRMVSRQIESRGVRDRAVLAAMRAVPRHRFVPASEQASAYADHPLPIGYQQTISQPYIVAFMTELAAVKPGDTVLEVGTGSGYQAAVLAEMGVKVYSIEIVAPLAEQASETLAALGYDVTVRHGDGYAGWPEHAPFDAILVTAAPPKIPEPLERQLEVGGRLVIPVGEYFQSLLVVTRTRDGYRQKDVLPVRFVPMTGEAQKR